MLSKQQTEHAIMKRRLAYAAFNRGDIDAAVELLDARCKTGGRLYISRRKGNADASICRQRESASVGRS